MIERGPSVVLAHFSDHSAQPTSRAVLLMGPDSHSPSRVQTRRRAAKKRHAGHLRFLGFGAHPARLCRGRLCGRRQARRVRSGRGVRRHPQPLGQSTLFGPAPQSAYDSARPDDRQFSALIADAETDAIEAKLAKEQRFDSDIWVVELEPGSTPVEELLNITHPVLRIRRGVPCRTVPACPDCWLPDALSRPSCFGPATAGACSAAPASPPSSRAPCPPRLPMAQMVALQEQPDRLGMAEPPGRVRR